MEECCGIVSHNQGIDVLNLQETKMMRLLLLLFVILSPCQRLFDFTTNVDNSNEETENVLLETFNSPDCTNPCWLGIEVGVSDRGFVVDVLEQHQINYAANGDYTYNIFLSETPSPLWSGREDPTGNLHLTNDTVGLMTFSLNLCPQAILNTYGIPEVSDRETFLEFLYPDYGMNFWFDIETGRVRSVILYTLDYIDKNIPLSERHSWDDFSDLLSDDCTDAVSH